MDKASGNGESRSHSSFWALTVGSVGVVYGDIGTSPLYAFREAVLAAIGPGGTVTREAVLGVLSLVVWSLIIVVTLKYVTILLRADNNGEGGTLSLVALAFRGLGRRTPIVLALGILGAAMFYGSSLITPALSVLSAVEGLKIATPALEPYVLPITVVILVGLFTVQSRGTAQVSRLFGPITLLWFLVMAVIGTIHIFDDPTVFAAVNPYYAFTFLLDHKWMGLITLGRGVSRRDRVGSALCGSRAFWTQTNSDRMVLSGIAVALAQLLRTGRARALQSGRHRRSVFPVGSGIVVAALCRPRDRGDGHREPGGDYGRLFADPPGDATRASSTDRDPSHLGITVRANLHAAGEYCIARRRAAPRHSCSARRALSPRRTCSR